METNEIKKERVILAGVHTGRLDYLEDTTDESIEELTGLCETAGAEVVGVMVQNKAQLESGTYMGEGKLSELAEFCGVYDYDVSRKCIELFGSESLSAHDARFDTALLYLCAKDCNIEIKEPSAV